MQAGEGTRDVLLTMAVPTLLLVGLRISPRRFVDSSADLDESDDD